jgi:hypothetical protein
LEERTLKIRLLLAGSAAVAAACLPFAAHATPGTGSGTCPGTDPAVAPQPGSGGHALPDGGTAYVNTGGYSGVTGPHGYIQAGQGGINGYSNDQGHLNGNTDAAAKTICLGFNGTTVHS